MTAAEKEQIHQAILEKQKALELEIADLKELTRPISPENAIGRVSRMDAINNKSVNEAALRKALETQKRLKHTLSRMDEPNFGDCTRCGNAIPIQRILLVPGSTRCVHCAGR